MHLRYRGLYRSFLHTVNQAQHNQNTPQLTDGIITVHSIIEILPDLHAHRTEISVHQCAGELEPEAEIKAVRRHVVTPEIIGCGGPEHGWLHVGFEKCGAAAD